MAEGGKQSDHITHSDSGRIPAASALDRQPVLTAEIFSDPSARLSISAVANRIKGHGTGAAQLSMTGSTVAIILAGGQAQRMGGGDKGVLTIGRHTILERAIACLRGQCQTILLNANGNPSRFVAFGLPVLADTFEGFPGPLAGILAGLDWIAINRPDVTTMLSVPADCPFLPRDLLERLDQARNAEARPIACANSGGFRHPVIALWPIALRHDLRQALEQEGLRKVERWAERHGITDVEWPIDPVDPFFNVNTPEDIREATAIARRFLQD